MTTLQLSPLQAILRSSWSVVQAAPKAIFFFILLSLLQNGSPTLVLFLDKTIIDEITRLLQTGTISTEQVLTALLSNTLLLGSIISVIVLNLSIDALSTITNIIFSGLEQRVKGYFQHKFFNKVATFADISLFENPELLNLVQLAEKAVERLQTLTMLLGIGLMGIFMLIPAVAVSFTIVWWVPLIVLFASAPAIYVKLYYVRKSWDIEKTQASAHREMQLYKQMLIAPEYAKELRLFGLQNLLLGRWFNLFHNTFKQMEKMRIKGTSQVLFWSIFGEFGAAIPYIYVILGTLDRTYTIGDLALYAGLVIQLRRGLNFLMGNLSQLYDVALGTVPLFQLLELESKLQLNTIQSLSNSSSPLTLSSPKTSAKIQLENVSFTYPNSNFTSLNRVSLTLYPGQTVALVGENGAGKTTLAKLLCRLYDPDCGKILWNGEDLRGFELDDLRQKIAVVLQDYARFPLTVRENIAFGNLEQLNCDSALLTAIEKAGMTRKIHSLPKQLDTPLGKQLEGGVDLSGGQWQRIAIARSLMRQPQAELLIFDEPTAALDPKTEDEIYKLFADISQNKTAVVVTHRLALARNADVIIVLEQGKIIETGTHAQLMELGQQYYQMFNRQASHYV
ncbi:ABC transporter ATP-binding protein [Limnoraphis robusta]|uniref:ABC transporter ATP-binding protein n=1 Tax=Limnoraphis robusta TaxID=1118279 RepID=UPI002B21D69A|nr:ABC transporter ATP-binding protein [Limnoraphis robusta]MEA5498695.1 ABC transporter ATP-binding protein [Limnoraphis robusta BA-68 BA1]